MYVYNNQGFFDEKDLRSGGFLKVAGVDEVGRGGVSGPVVVCCCMLPIKHNIKGIKDSKALTHKKRLELSEQILETALSVSIALATNEEIDRINIYQATKSCVYKAVENMSVRPDFLTVDGNFTFDNLAIPYISVPGGDGAQIYVEERGRRIHVGHHYENIAAASIVAKVYRDRLMTEYDREWPEYSFAKNKGYLTADHLSALKKYGPCPIHRVTFRGVLNG